MTPITIRSNQSSGKREAKEDCGRTAGDDRGAGSGRKLSLPENSVRNPGVRNAFYVGVYSFGDGERNRCRTAPLLFYRYLLKLSPNGSEGSSTDHE